jgi:meso-butanediol dehydrogenase / (S,S)-butanediol dehydrogenase / diacetyl reductase
MTGRLSGKTALITGTGGGQGRAAALLFAREGAKIVGCDLKIAGGEETVQMVHDAGGEMVSMQPVDLSDEEQVQQWIAFAVEAYGDFDILYNNASGVRIGTVESLTVADWDFDMANEVTLVFLAIKHALPVFKRHGGGVIINTASVAGLIGAAMPGNAPGNLVHNVAKAAVLRLSENLAVELSPLNIRVNAISPGVIDTPALHPILTDDPDSPMRTAMKQAILIQRIGQPEDIANAALYLASDEASYVTGANLVVDGGWTAGGGVGQPNPELLKAMEGAMASLQAGDYTNVPSTDGS